MPARLKVEFQAAMCEARQAELQEVILGLHWDPPKEGSPSQAVDLDAFCVVSDLSGSVLDVVHPGHPRSFGSSIVHTGDSRTGMSDWDDERIFVFLDVLPEAVVRVDFLVVSITGEPFDSVPGARCHLSDRISEFPRVRVELTALRGQTAHTVAVLRRNTAGWKIATDAPRMEPGLIAELQRLAKHAK